MPGKSAVTISGTVVLISLCAAGCSFMRQPETEEDKIPVLQSDPWRDPFIGPVPAGRLRIEEYSNGVVYYGARNYRRLMPEAMDTVEYAPAYIEMRNVRFRGMLNDFNNARMRADRAVVRVRDLPDGRRNIARVALEGDVRFADDRGQTASSPLELDFETSTLTAGGKHKALMSEEK
ncbi:MAG: hypothetical protein N3A38_04420 [Planctomycetota bacterium]|nr:hypothetical protein [Planctomycetota bacterium]